MSILERLTRGVVERNVVKEGAALLNKWSRTGLLEGLAGDYEKQSMAVLLENQAKELLREANSQGSDGNVQGFAAVAFPLVRRVFGGLLANDLVSVQPMSLPSGLIFFLDFTKSSERDNTKGDSIHGQGVVGSGIINGVTLGENGFYHLSQGYSSARGSAKVANYVNATGQGALVLKKRLLLTDDGAGALALEENAKEVDFDPDLVSEAIAGGTDEVAVCTLYVDKLANSTADCEVTPGKNLKAQMTPHHVMTLALSALGAKLDGLTLVRRLTKVLTKDAKGRPTTMRVVLRGEGSVLRGGDLVTNNGVTTIANASGLFITAPVDGVSENILQLPRM